MCFRFCRPAMRYVGATASDGRKSVLDVPVVVFLILAACAALLASPGKSEALPGGPPVNLIRSDQSLIEFDVVAEGTSFVTRETAAGTFEAVRIPGFFSYGRPGEAQLPHRTFLVGIPVGMAYDVTAVPLDEVTFGSKRILPAPVVSVGEDGTSEERTVPSGGYYGRDESLPSSPLLGIRESWMRNQRVLGIDVSPVRYNPVSGVVVVSSRVKITISLRRGAAKSVTGRHVQNIEAGTPDGLETLYRSSLVNYEPARSWRVRGIAKSVNQVGDSFASSSNWCKLSVKARGIYKVTGSDLTAAGVSDLGSINPLTLRLFNGGGLPLAAARDPSALEGWMKECAIEVFDGGDGRFDATDYILFYGMGTDGWNDYFYSAESPAYLENGYTDTNVYWLTWDGSFVTNPEPVRVASKRGVPVTSGAYFPEYFPARLHVEKNTFYDPSLAEINQRWEKWWYQELRSTSGGSQSYLYTFDAPNLEPAVRCSLVVRLWAPCTITENTCGYQHKGRILFNRQWVDEDSLYGVNSRLDLSGTGFWGQEKDSLIVTVSYASDVLDLAWYELFYGKKLIVDSNSFALSSPDTTAIVRYPLSDVTDTTGLRLFDVTDYFSPIEVAGYDLEDVGSSFTLEFEDTLEAGRTKQYLLVSSAGIRSPDSITLKQFSRFLRDTGNGADYIIVTHPTLAQGVQGLRTFRETKLPGVDDPATYVALTSEIYDEFSWGVTDACALRDFIMYAYWNWTGKPRQVSYVFFVGEASYDPRNFLGTGSQDLVPTWENYYDFQMQAQLVNDDFFALLDGPGDVLSDVAVGRATVRSLGEESTVLDHKIVPYASSPSHGVWRNKAIIVADDNYKLCAPDELGYWHVYLSDSVAALHLPKALDKDKIYLTEYPRDAGVCYKSKAKQAFMASFDEGALIVNYIGHGSGNQLAHEQVFRLDDVGSLTNEEKLPLFFAGSCKVAKFDEPSGGQEAEGIAEKLLRQEGGGTIASVAATGLVYSDQNYDFNGAFYDFVFPGASLDSTVAIGVALQTAKNLLAISNEDTVNARKYILMGDPALQLAVPELKVAFDTTSADTVHLGEVVTVSGQILDGDKLAQWYDATVDLDVSGSEIVRKPSGWSPYYLPGYRFFHGSASAEQGKFDFSFVVPVDTLILGPKGRARGYSVGSVDGTGIVSPMVIDTAVTTPSDSIGPSVVLRFDNDARYVPPQSVLHVILRDQHGICLTGTSASNSILLQIDKAIEPVDLTSSFAYYENSYQDGQIDYVIPTLSIGSHSVLVVAHDNLGNRGSADLKFEIVERDTLLLKEVINYPNPFKKETYINFDLTADGIATIKIFTVSGALIRKLCENSPVRRGNNQFKWDGKDAEGDEVANGIYLYRIDVKDGEGDKDSFIGRAAVLK